MKRRTIARQTPRARQKAAIGVFGIDAIFNGPTVDFDIVLSHRQLLTCGDADHLFDQINAGDAFGDRMLHLQPRVHLKEIKAFTARVRARYDQFNRSGGIIANRTGQGHALLTHRFAHFGRDKG